MKVKVFICTLAFLHIKEEILMKRKNYKVKVKLIFETTMDHSQTSMQKAQEDVNRVLTDYLKNKKLNILNLIVGCEQNGTRPVVIVQNDLANKCSPVVLIAPITSKVNSKPKLKTHVYLEKDKKITHDSIVLMEQIRVLDKSRLGSFLCSLNKEKLQEIDKALICSFQIDIASYIDNLIKKEEKR